MSNTSLTETQEAVLSWLIAAYPEFLVTKEVAERIEWPYSKTYPILKQLERKGLVARVSLPGSVVCWMMRAH